MRIVSGETKPHTLPDVFGIDYDTAVRDVMETGGVEEDVEFIRSSLLRALRTSNKELLNLRKQELRKQVSEKRFNEIMNEVERTYNARL